MTPARNAAATQVADESRTEGLAIDQLRRALADLFAPRPLVYWFDLLASAGCFYGGFAISAALPLGNPLTYAAAAASVLGLYRAIIFIHELAHLPPGHMPGFRFAWHVLCGIPLLAPAFLYGSHADHHRRPAYGTGQDGEYLPWGTAGQRLSILAFLLSSFATLPVAVLRFGVLAPMSWLSPRLRGWVAVHASSLAIHPRYRRTPPPPTEDRAWRRHEAWALVYLLTVAFGLAIGAIPTALLLRLYLTLSGAMLLNGLRTLVAHRYRLTGQVSTATEQLLDSVNYPRRSWVAPLWAPVGLRFHAVHHLFAGIPYHNLAAAHGRIVSLLPPDSLYHQTAGHGLLASLGELWRAARARPSPGSRGEALGEALGRGEAT